MERQTFFGIVFLVLSVVGVLVAVIFLLASLAFHKAGNKETAWVGRAPASLRKTNHKKNVTLYGKDHLGGGLIKTMFVKDMTKGTYVYTVEGKQYKRRLTKYLTTARQMPYLTSVFYIKLFPHIAYFKDDFHLYGVYGLCILMCSVGSCFLGIDLLHL